MTKENSVFVTHSIRMLSAFTSEMPALLDRHSSQPSPALLSIAARSAWE